MCTTSVRNFKCRNSTNSDLGLWLVYGFGLSWAIAAAYI